MSNKDKITLMPNDLNDFCNELQDTMLEGRRKYMALINSNRYPLKKMLGCVIATMARDQSALLLSFDQSTDTSIQMAKAIHEIVIKELINFNALLKQKGTNH